VWNFFRLTLFVLRLRLIFIVTVGREVISFVAVNTFLVVPQKAVASCMAVFLATLAERPFRFLVRLLINVLVIHIACFQILKLVAHPLESEGFFFFFPFALPKLAFSDLFVFLCCSASLLITPINSCDDISLKGLHVA
jgi:hypothetical protein